MSYILNTIKTDLISLSTPQKVEKVKRFFKNGKGQSCENNYFLGLTAAELHSLSKKYYKKLDLTETEKLLKSDCHDERMLALLMLKLIFDKADKEFKKQIFSLYLRSTEYINNWALVDASAQHIVGRYLKRKNRNILYRLAESQLLWDRRISIVSTFYFIKQNDFADTLKISEILLHDTEDLIHKATGWMLREVGKRSPADEENFLRKFYKTMPRTMLRYAIERFEKNERQKYLRGEV
ncbi:MAG: DNA alkylation repair protein [Victivallales bacterium]|nr:DNA alkylation repair protein [Victivallales bacterium]